MLCTITASNYWTTSFKENHLSYHLAVTLGYLYHRLLLNSHFGSLDNRNNSNYHLFHNFLDKINLKCYFQTLQTYHKMRWIQAKTWVWISNWCIQGDRIVIFKQLLSEDQQQIFYFQIRILLEIHNLQKVS